MENLRSVSKFKHRLNHNLRQFNKFMPPHNALKQDRPHARRGVVHFSLPLLYIFALPSTTPQQTSSLLYLFFIETPCWLPFDRALVKIPQIV